MKALVAVGCVLLVASAGQAQSGGIPGTQAAPLASANPEKGKALFVGHQCFACHGYNGETGTPFLKDDGTFTPRLLTVRGFIAFIRAPRPNEAPPAGSSVTMPSYGVTSLPEQQAADLFSYIKTFKPTEPALKDIPLLNAMLREGGKRQK